jgi:hypothetical protein
MGESKMSLYGLLVSALVEIVVSLIILSPVLWLVGRALVGKEKAKFTDALWTVLIGTVVGFAFGFLPLGLWGELIGLVVQLVIWLYLVKYFFDCGWSKALVISILMAVVFTVIAFVLTFLGFAILSII